MCGYIGNVTDSPLVRALMISLGLEGVIPSLRNNTGSGPAALIDVLLEDEGGRRVQPAVWWLLLEQTETGGFKPSRYTSFNSRSDKLGQSRSAGFQPFRASRCIVPASYIIEGDGPKGQRRYHRIEPTGEAFALGGLFRRWLDKKTGELQFSCSVITLPPLADRRWQAMHSKSMPLMLPTGDSGLIDDWLSPQVHDTHRFADLLTPRLSADIVCTPIDRPGTQQAIGDRFVIEKDA